MAGERVLPGGGWLYFKYLEMTRETDGQPFCGGRRVFPGAAAYEDGSDYTLIRALAERHHKACTCPTFADNDRRLNRLIHALETKSIRGVVFHVLKGCHPFDMDAGILEERLKEKNVRFLKIETDYVREDEQNIVTRLEAFSRTLQQTEESDVEYRR